MSGSYDFEEQERIRENIKAVPPGSEKSVRTRALELTLEYVRDLHFATPAGERHEVAATTIPALLQDYGRRTRFADAVNWPLSTRAPAS